MQRPSSILDTFKKQNSSFRTVSRTTGFYSRPGTTTQVPKIGRPTVVGRQINNWGGK